jgi:hypothetical protein
VHLLVTYLSGFVPEITYVMHDEELLTIVAALKEWRCYLKGAHHQIPIYADHKSLEYLITTKI